MRPDLAERTPLVRPRVLVLGPKSTAERIASGLEREGFDPCMPEESSFSSIEGLRASLERFRETSDVRKNGGSYVHPGTSGWGERPEFPQICQDLGLGAISCPARLLSLFSNKLTLLSQAERLRIPHVVLHFDPFTNVAEVEQFIAHEAESGKRVRFPLVLKTVRSGFSGASIRVIYSSAELREELQSWMSEMRGDESKMIFFLERYLEGARYLSLPFARFSSGETRFFPMVDSSLQQRHRRLIDICPANGTPIDLIDSLHETASRFLEECQFVGIGALDFLIDDREFYLVDGSCRLNNGFSLWETVAGTNAVAWQLAALGISKKSASLVFHPESSHSVGILARIRSEDAWTQLPQPGVILEQTDSAALTRLHAEFEPNFSEGDHVTFDSDGFLGTLAAYGRRYEEALERLRKALAHVWIAGSLQTNERLIAELLDHPWIKDQVFHAGFLDEEFVPSSNAPDDFLGTSLWVLSQRLGQRVDNIGKWVVADRRMTPQKEKGEWMSPPRTWKYPSGEAFAGFWLSTDKKERMRMHFFPLPSGRFLARVGQWFFQLRAPSVEKHLSINALTSGKVQSLLFREGVLVPARKTCTWIESQHALVPHSSPVDIRIVEWRVEAEQEVLLGDTLAIVEKV